ANDAQTDQQGRVTPGTNAAPSAFHSRRAGPIFAGGNDQMTTPSTQKVYPASEHWGVDGFHVHRQRHSTRKAARIGEEMNAPLFIPPRTRAEIASPAPHGQRHDQMRKVVLPLLGAGLTPEAVFVQLRGMYEADVSDREIRDIVRWAVLKNPQPCGYAARKRG